MTTGRLERACAEYRAVASQLAPLVERAEALKVTIRAEARKRFGAWDGIEEPIIEVGGVTVRRTKDQPEPRLVAGTLIARLGVPALDRVCPGWLAKQRIPGSQFRPAEFDALIAEELATPGDLDACLDACLDANGRPTAWAVGLADPA